MTTLPGQRGSWTIVHLVGEIDAATESTLRAHLEDLLHAGRMHLILDLEDVSFMDSRGLN